MSTFYERTGTLLLKSEDREEASLFSLFLCRDSGFMRKNPNQRMWIINTEDLPHTGRTVHNILNKFVIHRVMNIIPVRSAQTEFPIFYFREVIQRL